MTGQKDMQAAEFVTSYFDAWNRQDARGIADHLSENGTYLDIPEHQHMSREQLIAHLDELFELEPNIYELTGEVLAGENTIAFQYKVYPREPENPDQQCETWYGAEFITLRDGRAQEITDYYEPQGAQPPHSPLARGTGARQVQRYAKSGLNASQLEALKRQLTEQMEIGRKYLQPDLTLPELAEAMDCTVNHLSQAINAGFGVSFFDYLNEYRVKDAMHLLGDSGGESRTVLEVALDVGFNSTSTFYVAFRKVTGKTPAQYRRSQSSRASATSPGKP
jgi:AraC-like DNA-binding protein